MTPGYRMDKEATLHYNESPFQYLFFILLITFHLMAKSNSRQIQYGFQVPSTDLALVLCTNAFVKCSL